MTDGGPSANSMKEGGCSMATRSERDCSHVSSRRDSTALPFRMLRRRRGRAELRAASVVATQLGLAVMSGNRKAYKSTQSRTWKMKWNAFAEGGKMEGLSATEAARSTSGAKASRNAAVCS